MNIRLKNQKEWIVRSYDKETARRLADTLSISDFSARLLAARGYDDPTEAAAFLHCDNDEFPDPFLLPDMAKAVERITTAIGRGEKILIYGDYDVDGLSSVAALYLYLSERGAQVCYYIPERHSEGYGLNSAAIERFAAAKISLIITVDTGITAIDEVAVAKSYGIDVVITDHHECVLSEDKCISSCDKCVSAGNEEESGDREENDDRTAGAKSTTAKLSAGAKLPSAYAVVNPKRPDSRYPFRELAGVGVVFKLLCALAGEDAAAREDICARYLDLVSLGTVADVMPLVGENRHIVSRGLSILNRHGGNLGARALLYAAGHTDGKVCTASTIGFLIAPRLNAAGRIGDVNRAAELLITHDPERAESIAELLCEQNRQRQAIETEIFAQAVAMVEQTVDLEQDKVLVLYSENWHQGVIGIVASRLCERYGLPCILITKSGEIGKGSARSIVGFNIYEAIGACREHLLKCGGHALAAGLSLELSEIDAFRRALNDYARERITDEMRVRKLTVDLELLPNEPDLRHAEAIATLEPFGTDNPAPVFVLRDTVVDSITPLSGGKHLRLLLACGGNSFTALYFNKTPEEFPYARGEHIDVAFHLEINDFRGNRTVQLHLLDTHPCDETLSYINKQAKAYLRAISMFSITPENLPEMTDFRQSFVYLRSAARKDLHIEIHTAARHISESGTRTVTPCMLNIMLDVFAERGLITMSRDGLNDAQIALCPVEEKVDLAASPLWQKLQKNVKA